MNWTDERVEMLKKLWAEGLSASQIAAKLGGVTRNAVIGKVHRLKLSARVTKPVKPAGVKTKRPLSGARPNPSTGSSLVTSGAGGGSGGGGRTSAYGTVNRSAPSMAHAFGATALKQDHQLMTFAEADQRPIEDVVVPIARKLTLVELSEHTCKWPYGDPMTDDFHFCGHASDEKSPYCKFHGKLAFQQPDRRRR